MRFIAFLLAGTVLSTPVLAATIEVRPGQSIQDAVNRAQAGDEVVVDDGTYGAFEIRTNGISVRARNKGGAHVVATGNNQPAIAAYSQSDIAVRGFRLTSRNGDGVKIGGDASAPLAKNIVFEGNTTAYARLDGFKFFHADGITMRNNVVEMAGGGGAAGSAGNPNGDGGVDWVRVSNSLMEGNTVQRTNGWACAMIKNGSNNNRVVNNRFQNCEVNGIDMAAGSSGRSAAANTTGKTAFDNTIEGNVVEGGKGCAVKFGQKTSGNRLTDNDIDGRQCDKGTGNSGLAAGADDEVGAGGGGDGDYGGEEEYAGGGAEGGFLGTDYMGAGGGFSGGCDATIANGASAGAAAFGVISSVTGRATAGLQVAQQFQLLAQTLCDTEQTALQGEQLKAQTQMLRGMNMTTHADVLSTNQRLRSILTSGHLTGNPGTINRDYQEVYPERFPEGTTYQEMAAARDAWDRRTRDALDESVRIENAVLVDQQRTLRRSAGLVQAGRASGGIRGEIQATNGLLNEVAGSLDNLITATTAHHRALKEENYRREAEMAAAKRDSQDFMAGFGDCPECGQRPIAIFGNGGTVGRRGIAADPFGTGVP
ncbi:right-handed parallel beta-helix repeat-containing protein (plasmid) [Skermanella sp. TT6]|uniref:Right-handed parallel beta-helix repeat-containing protein n=1 Tax=Skermanella cutis TaxID=2775420 RepID=A0ABX7BI81_9PROT|nr:right-handed parallel beta-helix repeat-containing protein [Skermanella sp. TT6]QQP94075.1 right-handed parallel beta-helix repeat-containing protein [Skermanella sp. TT6]